jgi:hypothetical protein
MPVSGRRLTRLSSGAALLLGLSALATAGARADGGINQQADDEVRIRVDGGQVFLAQGGGEFRELPLDDGPQACQLKALLGRSAAASGPAGVRLAPMLLAGSGGTGFSWAPARSGAAGAAAGAKHPTRPAGGPPAQTTTPPRPGQRGKAAIERTGTPG